MQASGLQLQPSLFCQQHKADALLKAAAAGAGPMPAGRRLPPRAEAAWPATSRVAGASTEGGPGWGPGPAPWARV
jgi:hypothetical protein